MLVPGVHTIYAVSDGFLPSFPVLVEISEKWPPIPKVKHFVLHPIPPTSTVSVSAQLEQLKQQQLQRQRDRKRQQQQQQLLQQQKQLEKQKSFLVDYPADPEFSPPESEEGVLTREESAWAEAEP